MEIMGDDSIPVELDAKIRWAGCFYRYPLQFQDMIKGIPFLTLVFYTLGLFYAQIRKALVPWTPKNAEEALGNSTASRSTGSSSRTSPTATGASIRGELSATFITTKMPRLSAVDVIKKALGKVGIKDKAVSRPWTAPCTRKRCTTRAPEPRRCRATSRAPSRRPAAQSSIDAEVTRVEIHDGRVTRVRYRKDGQELSLECDECISTIPLPWLVQKPIRRRRRKCSRPRASSATSRSPSTVCS